MVALFVTLLTYPALLLLQACGCYLHRPVHLCIPDLRSTLKCDTPGLYQQGEAMAETIAHARTCTVQAMQHGSTLRAFRGWALSLDGCCSSQ